MIMGVLPKQLEDEILEKSYKLEFQTHESIIAWAKRKVINVRQKELSEHSRRPTSSHVKSLKHDDSEGDADEPAMSWGNIKKEIVSAMRAAVGQIEIPPPPTVDALQTRPAKKTGDNNRRRSNSPSGGQK